MEMTLFSFKYYVFYIKYPHNIIDIFLILKMPYMYNLAHIFLSVIMKIKT